MSLEEKWQEALKKTEIVYFPMRQLMVFEATHFEYVLLAESEFNKGDTVVRRGGMTIHRPAIVLPGNAPLFEGFESEKGSDFNEDSLATFFLLRGISFPSLKYKNESYELDLYEGNLNQAVKHYEAEIRSQEKISTSIVIGDVSSWQFSLLILAGCLIENYLDRDIQAIFNRIKKR